MGMLFPANTGQLVARFEGALYSGHVTTSTAAILTALETAWNRNSFSIFTSTNVSVIGINFREGTPLAGVTINTTLQENRKLIGCVQ